MISNILIGVQKWLPVIDIKSIITKIFVNKFVNLDFLWLLSRHSLANLDQYLIMNRDNENVVKTFTENLLGLLRKEILNDNEKIILSNILSRLISNKFSSQFSSFEENSRYLSLLSEKILDYITTDIFTNINNKDIKRINIYQLVVENCLLDFETLKKYFMSQLFFFLKNTSCEKFSLFKVITSQSNWRFNNTNPFLHSLIIQLLSPFEIIEVEAVFKVIEDYDDINWQFLLTLVSHFLVLYPGGSSFMEKFTRNLIRDSLSSGNEELITISFILVRQGCNEGADVFISYSDWFKRMFEECSTPANTKRTFTLLMKVLSDLIPFEPVSVLKVHVTNPPFAPKNCRSLLHDYITIAKLQLQDQNETVDGLICHLGSDSKEMQETLRQQASKDVEKMISFFENSKKIPPSCVELSLFRKPYYISYFLPSLLKTRQLPEIPDSKMEFINLLYRSGKIPISLFKNYELECAKFKKESLTEINSNTTNIHVKDLNYLFKSYPQAVINEFKSQALPSTSAIISEISTQLQSNFSVEHRACNNSFLIFHPSRPPPITKQSIQVINLLLHSFGVTLSSVAKLNCGNEWAQNLLSTCMSINCLQEALYYRLWELIFNLRSNLSDQHIWILSAVLVTLSNLCSSLAPVCLIETTNNSNNIIDIIFDSVPCSTEKELTFCYKLFSFYLQHIFLLFSNYVHHIPQNKDQGYIPASLINKFSLVNQIYPEIETKCPSLVKLIYTCKQYREIERQFKNM